MKRLLLITLSLLMVQGAFADTCCDVYNEEYRQQQPIVNGKDEAAREFRRLYLASLSTSAATCAISTLVTYLMPEPGLAKNVVTAVAVASGLASLGLLALPPALAIYSNLA